ncbi:hypothetical protein O7O60_004552 [Salmonella enterica]|uniref:Uncharacterized protein n=4 Tax=Salmonella enterica TaxID=28901 RepID=A0A5Y6MEQ6_SALHO|nr:hypothetical protein [Salmonella enterica subsp. enterica]EAM3329179.1 hypothetical protein [Salmonella enterica]EBF8289890.1 hypothetical protein [Salmonella enterica subsp. houtenae]EBH8336513.1 hypothetical protein [Salmonella enterica subsp. houtenae serovar Houten]ECM3647097.1 hypothetical protein [Salmonella enterica subsp. enterica serovar Typhimurium]EDP9795144.1 hypothetical protein [Salmonella enterica subsp. salamae]EDS0027840.1 hypothetical protein [Salmonella enterica subsp. e
MTEDTKLGSALVSALKSDEIIELGKEYAELGIDSLIESNILESIPFVSTVVGLYKTVSSVKDQLFTEKVIRFLTHFSDLSDAERINMTERLNEDDKFSGKAGARLIEIIDRMESEDKPEIAAEFLKAFAREEIDFNILRRLLVALERIPSFDIRGLAVFAAIDSNQAVEMDEAFLDGLVNAGLGKSNGAWKRIIVPTDLCMTFVHAGKL